MAHRLLLLCALGAVSYCTCVTNNVNAQQPVEQDNMPTNALIDSTSPYLLQHARNPVNWMPWGPEAFAKAKAENKPIFVSIGYSTCYWCHVMERESFEDEDVAAILNEHYIAIKVDREERPDIDEQLMLATQLLTGRGGWPNSVWLTVDGRPWMAGTYFPKLQFMNALNQLAHVWEREAENVEKQADSLSAAIREASRLPRRDTTSGSAGLEGLAQEKSPLQQATEELKSIFDASHGGFGTKPKFPPHGSLRLLALTAERGDDSARTMLFRTLDGMWCGGIHDHVGGGFHRYATDERWLLPHFEKMLYDNAQLMRAYAEAYAISPEPRLALAINDIHRWLQREMQHPQGGFYSAIDSESEGEEGVYYTWTMEELREVLGAKADHFAALYQFEQAGNFFEEASGQKTGGNIPHLSLEHAAKALEPQHQAMLDLLLQARSQRESPHIDDKILTGWNGLMISALARSGQVVNNTVYTQSAAQAAQFILDEMWVDGQLQRSWRAGQAHLPAYLNDYAFFIEGLVELHLATGEPRWLEAAMKLARKMQADFEDQAHGGFFFTSQDHEKLLVRSKNLLGGGNLPSGNGVATESLIKLYELTHEEAFLDSAKRSLRCFADLLQTSPRQIEHLVLAHHRFHTLSVTESDESALASFQDESVEVTVLSADSQSQPKTQFEGQLVIDIRPSMHLYAPDREIELVEPTELTLVNPKSSAFEVSYPPGESKKDRILEKTISIYRGRVTIPFTIPIQTGKSKRENSAPLEIELSLKIQACDDTRCLEPKSIPLKFNLPLLTEKDH